MPWHPLTKFELWKCEKSILFAFYPGVFLNLQCLVVSSPQTGEHQAYANTTLGSGSLSPCLTCPPLPYCQRPQMRTGQPSQKLGICMNMIERLLIVNRGKCKHKVKEGQTGFIRGHCTMWLSLSKISSRELFSFAPIFLRSNYFRKNIWELSSAQFHFWYIFED